MKSYTDIEQSKKLAEILPIESADMHYERAYFEGKQSDWFIALGRPIKSDDIIPCWSLAALLNVLPDYTLQTNSDGTVFLVCDSKKPMILDAYNNPVDACVEIVLKLHELKML